MGVLRAFLAWLLSWIPWLDRKAVEDQRNVHPAPVLLRIGDQPTGKSLVLQNTTTGNINYADDEPNTDDTATLLASTTSVGLTRSAQNCSPMDFTHVSMPRPAKLPAFQKTAFVENWLQNDIAKPPKPEVGGSSLNSARKSSRASSKDSHESGNPVATDYKNVEGCPADEIGKSIIRQAADEAVQPSPTAIVTYLYRVSVYPSFKLPVVYCMDRGFPQKHRLGNGEIMPPGLEIALLHMREGEWSKFRIASKHGYGKSGKRAFDVSSTTVLYVEVELLKVQETAMADKVASEEPFFWTETFSQSELTIAQRQLWSLGKVSYEEKEYTQAYERFSKAIEIGTTLKVGEKDEGILSQRNSTLAHLYNNQALTCLMLSKWDEAIQNAKSVLQLKADWKTCHKAVHSMAKAYFEKGDSNRATDTAQRGLTYYPNSPDLKKIIEKCQHGTKEFEENLRLRLLNEHRESRSLLHQA